MHSLTGSSNEQALVTLRKDVEVLPGVRESNGTPSWLLFDPLRDRYFSIGWLEFEMTQHWTESSPRSVVDLIHEATTLDTDEQDVLDFNQFLIDNELARCDSPTALNRLRQQVDNRKQALQKSRAQRQVFRRFSLVYPDSFLTRTLPFVRPLMSVWWRRTALLLAFVCVFLIMRQWPQFSQAVAGLFVWQSAPLVLMALFFIKVVHELGHAYTCKYYGLTVPTMGVALFVVWPFLFTNTNAAWRLTKRTHRAAVGLAGVLAESYVGIVCILLWFVVSDELLRSAALFLGTVSVAVTIAINVNPFMRWDGYYVLSDWLGIDNLQPRSFALARWWLRQHFLGFKDPCPEQLGRRRHRILVVYAFATWAYRIILFMTMAMLAYTGLFKAVGIIAALLVCYWFVLKPVIKEGQFLMNRRSELSINRHSILFICLLVMIVALFVVPLDSSVARKGQMLAAQQQQVYPPIPGRVKRVSVDAAVKVSRGDVLFEIESAEHDFQLQQVAKKTAYYQVLKRRQSDREVLQERSLIDTQLRYLEEQRQGLLQQKKRMSVMADLDGYVTYRSDQLATGAYVSADEPLVQLVAENLRKVVAYVNHTELKRLTVGAMGSFVPEDPLKRSQILTLVEIDRSPSTTLESLALAQRHGGDVPVSGDATVLTPNGAYYRLTFSIVDPPGANASEALRGTVHVDAQRRSLVSQIHDGLAGLLIRESGF